MSRWGIALRLGAGLLFAFWSFNVLMVAVFAVPDRYGGGAGILMSLLVVAGGFAPVVLLLYLFRGQLAPPEQHRAFARPGAGAPGELPPLVDPISDRELEVLALIARGHSNKEIAAELTVTVGTVKTHTNNINRKLGSRTRTQAVARARDYGLL